MSDIKNSRIKNIDKTIKKVKDSSGFYMEVINNVITFDNDKTYETIEDMSEYEIGKEITYSLDNNGKIKHIFCKNSDDYYISKLKKEKKEWFYLSSAGILPFLFSLLPITNYLNTKDGVELAFSLIFLALGLGVLIVARLGFKVKKKEIQGIQKAFNNLEKEGKVIKNANNENIPIEKIIKENQYANS